MFEEYSSGNNLTSDKRLKQLDAGCVGCKPKTHRASTDLKQRL